MQAQRSTPVVTLYRPRIVPMGSITTLPKPFDLRHPPPCLVKRHAKRLSTQRCIHCGFVRCYKCVSEKTGKTIVSPALLHFECARCQAKHELVGISSRPLSEKAYKALTELRVEEELVGIASGAGRAHSTLDLHAGNILRLRQFAHDTFDGLQSMPNPWTPAVYSKFIFQQVRNGFVWSVVDHYMTSMRRWIRLHSELVKIEPDMSAINSERVKAVLAYAKNMMPHQKNIRLPTSRDNVKEMLAPITLLIPLSILNDKGQAAVNASVEIAKLAALPAPVLSDSQWNELMDAWVTSHLALTLIRRSRLAAVDYMYEPWASSFVSELDMESLPDTVEWHACLDEKNMPSIMVVGTKEKNFHARNKSKRFLDDLNVLNIPIATILLWIAEQLRLPFGPLFRQRNGTSWSKSHWAKFSDRFTTRVIAIPREKFGMTSFRRGLASLLRVHGMSEAEIAYLGFWTSKNGPKPYMGCERRRRLELLSGTFTRTATLGPAPEWGVIANPKGS